MNKLLIIGHGQIGSALATDLTEYDISLWPGDLDELGTAELRRLAPDAVINAAGKTNLAWCEANAREAVRSNTEAPVRLFSRILDLNARTGSRIRFVHFSSGCVWDGPYDSKGEPFQPYTPPTPACLYAWTKASADALLMDMDPRQLAILRPRQVYSDSSSPRNTLVKLLGYPKLIDTPNSMSSMAVIEKTVKHVLHESSDWGGIWNVYDSGTITPFEVGKMLADAGLRDEPSRISKAELDQFHQPKRVDTVLYDARLESAIRPSNVQQELQRAIEGLNVLQVTSH